MRAFVISLTLVTVALAGCGGGDRRAVAPDARHPLLFLAVDGLEWSVMGPLIAAGRMPVTASLMARGTYGYLESMDPTLSPVVWTTIATGKTPDEHGIKHFIYTGPGGEADRHYYTSGHRRTKALWNILSDYGLSSHVLGWWMTYPAESINGVMVAQTNTTAVLDDPNNALWKGSLLRGVEGQVTPPERQNEVMDILETTEAGFDSLAEAIFGEAARAPKAPLEQVLWDQSRWAFRADAVYLEVAKRLLREGSFDVVTPYVGGADVAGHRFWRYAYPQDFFRAPDPRDVALLGRVIDDYYVYLDRVIGELIAVAPPNTTVIIASDHGMHTFNPRGDFVLEGGPESWRSGNHLDWPPGVFIAAGPPIADATPGDTFAFSPDSIPTVGGVYDMLPTLLALKGVPIAKDFSGTVLTRVIDPAWLARFPVREIETHDDAAFEAARHERMKEATDQAERLEQLKSLGYIR